MAVLKNKDVQTSKSSILMVPTTLRPLGGAHSRYGALAGARRRAERKSQERSELT